MRIKSLLLTLLSISILSCEKEQGEEQLDKKPTTDFEIKLNDYGLFNVEKEFESYNLGIDTNNIYFVGRLDQKLCVESFNKTNKTNLLSWVSDVNLEIEVHEGYGVNSTHQISLFGARTAYNYNNEHAFILWGIAKGSQYRSDQRIITSDLYFTSSNRKYESMTFPTKAYFYTELISWYEDQIIVSKTPVDGTYGRIDSCFCYSMEGEEIFKFEKTNNFYPVRNYIAISPTNYIEFSGDSRGAFYNKNIIENKQIWESNLPLSDLPEDTRIDSIKFSRLSSSQLICNFNYTLYSGEKGEREMKIDIETGKLTD